MRFQQRVADIAQALYGQGRQVPQPERSMRDPDERDREIKRLLEEEMAKRERRSPSWSDGEG